MTQSEVFVCKFFAVNRFTAGAIAAGKISTLQHELRNDTVKFRALVMQLLATLANALLASAEGTEVFGCLGNLLNIW